MTFKRGTKTYFTYHMIHRPEHVDRLDLVFDERRLTWIKIIQPSFQESQIDLLDFPLTLSMELYLSVRFPGFLEDSGRTIRYREEIKKMIDSSFLYLIYEYRISEVI